MLTKNKKKSNTKKPGNKIFSLTCEDASHLGDPMAYATTEHMWTKLFSSIEKAKAYAEKKTKRPKDEIRWRREGRRISWDSGPYFFEIKEEKIL